MSDVKEADADSSGSSSSSSGSISSPAAPQVLTRTAIPALIADLDAGDVLECYAVSRHAVLHGLANSTLHVVKSALAVRYRPPANADSMHASKRPLELVLEYGPARAGSDLQHESIPWVVHEESGDTESYVSWENEAKVYYTESIDSHIFPTANYLASLSGTVLANLLHVALDYLNIRRYRRYQPFSVTTVEGDLKLPSSSDVDFVFAMYQHLAELGVPLQPVLPPAYLQATLTAAKIERVQISKDASAATISSFYQRLYDCLTAVATADYHHYDNSETPTLTPSAIPTALTQTTLPTPAPRPRYAERRQRKKRKKALKNENGTEDASLNATDAPMSESANETASSTSLPTATPTAATASASPSPSYAATAVFPTVAPSFINPMPSDKPVSHSDAAAQAAAQAQQAAQDAEESGNEQAAEAAQAAATAAQEAADQTASQAAGMAMDALLHGDAKIQAQTVATCFQDPVYGLSAGGNTTIAYLYWDGAFYYRVQLIAPYLQVVPVTTDLPQPPSMSDGAGGDFVDWTLALLLLGILLVGLLLLLQQIMGRNLRIIRPLYKFQRWFFDPTHYNAAALDDSEGSGIFRGGGHEYTFGEDVIPLSMGGRKAGGYLRSQHDDRLHHQEKVNVWRNGQSSHEDTAEGDMELVQHHHTRTLTGNGSSLNGSSNSERSIDDIMDDVEIHAALEEMASPSPRLFRDPDLVDLPDLKSKSKVAVPVSLSGGSGHSFEDSP